jgi:hypothetical protein
MITSVHLKRSVKNIYYLALIFSGLNFRVFFCTGRLVEDMENKIRSTLNEIYFGKTRDIVNGLRSVQPLAEARKTKDLQVTETPIPVLRIRIRMFLSLLDPDSDPLVGTRYGSGSFYNQTKIVKKTFIPTVL